MEPSPAQLRALLLVAGCSLCVVIAIVVWLVRSGRTVQLPDPGATPAPRVGRRRGGNVSIS